MVQETKMLMSLSKKRERRLRPLEQNVNNAFERGRIDRMQKIATTELAILFATSVPKSTGVAMS